MRDSASFIQVENVMTQTVISFYTVKHLKCNYAMNRMGDCCLETDEKQEGCQAVRHYTTSVIMSIIIYYHLTNHLG
jgi:hypothetical protein